MTGTGGVHLQSEGHVSTQSTPEAVLLSRHHHLFVSCFSERAGQVICQHMFKQTCFTQTCVIVLLSTVGLHTGFSLKPDVLKLMLLICQQVVSIAFVSHALDSKGNKCYTYLALHGVNTQGSS